ncbi:MAG: TolC family protein [Acidobacteria bacterium]|nr:TolC family protein [Acidobacteriota bacterium]
MRARWLVRCSALLPAFALAAGPAAAQALEPLGLRQALSEALQASPALAGARDAVDMALIQERLADSRFAVKIQPTINAATAPSGLGQRVIGIDVARRLPFGSEITTSLNSTSIGTGAAAMRDTGYTIGLTQPLFRGAGAAGAELKNARRSVVGSERGMRDARQQLIVTVADRFFAVLKQRRLVSASERALDRARTMSAASEARARVGLATQLDVLRADLLASQAAATLASQREALAGALEDLNLLLGRGPAQPLDVVNEDVSDEGLAALGFRVPDAGADTVERLVALALEARIDLREARDRIGDAERNLSVSRWNLLPQVSLSASYTERGLGPSSIPGLAELLNGWRVGIATNYALDRSEQIAAAGSAAVSLAAAERGAGDARRRVETDVRRAYRGWMRSRETIDIQRKTVELAERQVRLAQLRFERGLSTSLDVVDAEDSLYQAQSALIDAELGRALALLALERAAGTLEPERFANAGAPVPPDAGGGGAP